MSVTIKDVFSLFIPRRIYTGQTSVLPIEKQFGNGETLVLRHYQTFGEEVAYKCCEKVSNIERGFIVKNIRYGYFGALCNNVQDALASANDEWFNVMGIKNKLRQKQK